MKDDKGNNDAYRKFLYFFENKIAVHFKDLDNIFYNGLILALKKDESTMIIQERVRGVIPILLECVKINSIAEFTEVGK